MGLSLNIEIYHLSMKDKVYNLEAEEILLYNGLTNINYLTKGFESKYYLNY